MMVSTIINTIPEYVITAVISTAIFYGIKYAENLINAKVLHAKTAQSKELWGFIDQVAMTAVNSLVSKDITGDAKFAQATAIVQDALAKQGFTNVDVKSIESAVQSAYEKSPLTSLTFVKPNSDALGQKAHASVPDGSVKAIDPKEVK